MILISGDVVPWCMLMAMVLESSWNVMAHGDEREGNWRGNWRMEWVASTLHTTSEHTADAHTSAASSRLDWHPRWFKWTRPFRLKTKSGFCACATTFQTRSTLTDQHNCADLTYWSFIQCYYMFRLFTSAIFREASGHLSNKKGQRHILTNSSVNRMK